jgi:hypothetical protein
VNTCASSNGTLSGVSRTKRFRQLDGAGIRAGFWEYVMDAGGQPAKDKADQPKRRGTVRTKTFRHTWCSARLQSLDKGAPVSTDTVRREMGHE